MRLDLRQNCRRSETKPSSDDRIVATGTEIQLSQLTLLVTLIDESLIQPQK